jgi:hypothetical protein
MTRIGAGGSDFDDVMWGGRRSLGRLRLRARPPVVEHSMAFQQLGSAIAIIPDEAIHVYTPTVIIL